MRIDNNKHKIEVGKLEFEKGNESLINTLKNYIAIGYTVEILEPKKPKADRTTDAEIRAALADDPDALATYLELKKVSFFKAKRFYKEKKGLR